MTLELLLHDVVALAESFLQRLPVHDRHLSPVEADHAGLLKSAGDQA